MMERGPSTTSHQLVCSRSVKCENMQLRPSLRMASFHLKVEVFPWGSDDYKQHGAMMPKDGRERLHPFCAITLAPSALRPLRNSAIFWIIRLLALRRTPTRPKCRPTAQRWWKFPNKPAAET